MNEPGEPLADESVDDDDELVLPPLLALLMLLDFADLAGFVVDTTSIPSVESVLCLLILFTERC